MNAHEGAFVIIFKGRASSAVGFVADDQVKCCQAVLMLSTADHVDGVVGGEHHAHMFGIMTLEHFRREAICLGGGWVAEFVGEDLRGILISLTFLAYIAVGAYGEAVEQSFAFLCPFGKSLRQQRQTGHQEQHTLALAGLLFGNLQAGEGFAGTAGHDQLASLGIFKTGCYGIQCGLLMITQLLARLERNRMLGLVFGPVDLAVL